MADDALTEAFKEMYRVEESMDQTYTRIIGEIKDGGVKKVLEKIRDDEKRHEDNVRKILAIIG